MADANPKINQALIQVQGIRTMGAMRKLLGDVLSGLQEGTIDPLRANAMQKVAAQINESVYAELKTLELAYKLKQERAEFGSLLLTEKDRP